MRTYDVSGRNTIYEHEVIEAETPNEAFAKFGAMHPEMQPEIAALSSERREGDCQECWEWVGRCDGCGEDIVDDDDYSTGEDATLCAKCSELAP